MRERDDEGVVVRRLHTDLGEVLEFAGAIGLAVDEVVELVGVFGWPVAGLSVRSHPI